MLQYSDTPCFFADSHFDTETQVDDIGKAKSLIDRIRSLLITRVASDFNYSDDAGTDLLFRFSLYKAFGASEDRNFSLQMVKKLQECILPKDAGVHYVYRAETPVLLQLLYYLAAEKLFPVKVLNKFDAVDQVLYKKSLGLMLIGAIDIDNGVMRILYYFLDTLVKKRHRFYAVRLMRSFHKTISRFNDDLFECMAGNQDKAVANMNRSVLVCLFVLRKAATEKIYFRETNWVIQKTLKTLFAQRKAKGIERPQPGLWTCHNSQTYNAFYLSLPFLVSLDKDMLLTFLLYEIDQDNLNKNFRKLADLLVGNTILQSIKEDEDSIDISFNSDMLASAHFHKLCYGYTGFKVFEKAYRKVISNIITSTDAIINEDEVLADTSCGEFAGIGLALLSFISNGNDSWRKLLLC